MGDTSKRNGSVHLEHQSAATNPIAYHSMAYDVQPSSSDDFDIITLNIDDDFPIDATDDDILFKNEHQFDLANYIGGGSASSEISSLLLTPVKDAAAVATNAASPMSNLRQQLPQFLLPNPMNADPMKVTNFNLKKRPPLNTQTAAAHVAKVAKAPASNRRKRKNLSREFILESDNSSDTDSNDKFNSAINSKLHQMADDRKANGKRRSLKDDDPIWDPTLAKRNTVAKQAAIERNEQKHLPKAEQKDLHSKMPVKPTSGKGKGLRNLLKQQLLSDRPMNKSKLLKTKSSPLLSRTVAQNVTKVAEAPVHRIGVGRGKDIAITAKYYNRTESSDEDDNNVEHIEQQKSNKTYRYDQIYTDSEDSDMEIDVSSVPSTAPQFGFELNICSQENGKEKEKEKVKEQEMVIAKTDKCPADREDKIKETSNGKNVKEQPHEDNINRIRNGSVERKTKAMMVEAPSKPTDINKTKLNRNSGKPLLISQSLESTEFAKALVVNAKAKANAKCKSSSAAAATMSAAAAKKKNLEQQKRLIKSNILLQNPAKFKLLATETIAATPVISVNNKTATTISSTNEIETKSNYVVTNGVANGKLEIEMAVVGAEQVKMETECEAKEESQNVDAAKNENCVNESNKDVKPDISTFTDTITDDQRNEANAKRKLNIQEYLQRKSLKKTDQNGVQFANSIKKEHTDAMGSSNDSKDKSNDAGEGEDESNAGCLAGNSMYEEIIIVSIGCNTDISIPKTPLLSNIQKSVVEANAKISSNSLISSIQNVLLKKSQSAEQIPATAKKSTDLRKKKPTNSNGEENHNDGGDAGGSDGADEEHGENKVIMHLRKDRVRPMRHTVSIQTDPYFQFPPLQKLVPASKKQSTLGEKTIKRINSFPRGSSEKPYDSHAHKANVKNRAHSNSVGRGRMSESNYYSGDDVYQTQRPSRHSQFMEQHKSKQQQQQQKRSKRNYRNSHGRDSSRYSISKYESYSSRTRTISRSLSTSSESSVSSSSSQSSSSSSSSSTTSSSSSSAYISNESPRSLNSYGGSSSKSYYCEDDHQYYRKRTTSGSNSRRNQSTYRRRHANATRHRSNSPGLLFSPS